MPTDIPPRASGEAHHEPAAVAWWIGAWRWAAALVLGFAAGLPLGLTGQALQAWLSVEGLNVAAIGFLSLVGLPYTFKFLWAPLMDRFELPWFGRRLSWLVFTQMALAAGLMALAVTPPQGALQVFALLAVLCAFLSASQDVVIDAYRTDLLPARERGLGSSMAVLGYRLAMILSGGITLIWTDPVQGGAWTWPQVYQLMAMIMLGLAVVSAVLLPRLPRTATRVDAAGGSAVGGHDVRGFLALLATVALGYVVTDQVVRPALIAGVQSLWWDGRTATALQQRWLDLVVLLLGLGVTLPAAYWAARRAGFQTLLSGLSNYFNQPGSVPFLVFIVLYKLGDAFAVSLMTPFLLQGMAFSSAEVGVVNKIIGLWLTIGGALLGGALMLRLGLWRALMLFGVLQLVSNLGFWWLSVHGKGLWPGVVIPAFDWGFVHLAHPAQVDGGLLMVVAFDNLSGGMGTAALVAFLMSLCSQRYTATQYALLSAFAAIGRVWVGPLAGVLAESIGWPHFFLVSTVVALPALLLLSGLRQSVEGLEVDAGAASRVDED